MKSQLYVAPVPDLFHVILIRDGSTGDVKILVSFGGDNNAKGFRETCCLLKVIALGPFADTRESGPDAPEPL